MSKLVIPSNLAYSRSITPSVAVFSSFDSENTANKKMLNISEVTSVGTISNYKDIHTDDGKSIEHSNPQTVDICYLPLEHDSFELSFTVAFCGESLHPHSCNGLEFRDNLNGLVSAYINVGGYNHLAKLYLDNILSAKMLWRNSLADDINVTITPLRSEIETVTEKDNANYEQLIKEIGGALSGNRKRLVLKISISGWLGNGQEVFPSQEFVQNSRGEKQKGDKSKTLARTIVKDNFNVAAMHSQKIGNAIRQIDCWYDDFDKLKKALPIDPACVNKTEFTPYRPKASKRDLYSLFESKLIEFIEQAKTANSVEELDNDIHFIIANLIRGGVFGGKKDPKQIEKKEKAKKVKEEKANKDKDE